MQLRTARLCLDCEEVHDAQQCPVCASESFAYISRWIEAPERRVKPRPASSESAETYSRLLEPERARPGTGRLLTRGALGLTLLGLAGWAWNRQGRPGARRPRPDDPGPARPDARTRGGTTDRGPSTTT